MNYYEVLKVPSTASINEIKNAYKKLVKKYHPDVYEGNKLFAESKIKEINEAYEILSEKEAKDRYDAELNYRRYEPPREDFVKTYTSDDINKCRDAYANINIKTEVKSNKKVRSKYDFHNLGKKYFFKLDALIPSKQKENLIIILLLIIIVKVSFAISKMII